MTASLHAQGRVLQMKVHRVEKRNRSGGGVRGTIKEFSSGARRRMMEFFARTEIKGVRITFVTLTFQGIQHVQYAKKCLRRLLARIARKYPLASGVWRFEYQDRGAPHFHVLFYNLPYWPQRELQQVWTACTKEDRSIVDIRLVSGAKQLMNYISKYCAKKEVNDATPSLEEVTYLHAVGFEGEGKHWGLFNRDAIPMAQVLGGMLISHPVIKALSEMAWREIGMDNKYGSMSFTLFTPFADLLCQEALARGGLEYDDLKASYVGETIWYKRHSDHVTRYTPF